MGIFQTSNDKNEIEELTLAQFELNLFQEISKSNPEKNIIISPLSIYHILSLVATGTKENTLKEILNVLNNKDHNEMNKINKIITSVLTQISEIEIANGIFTKFTPEKNFMKNINEYKAKTDKLKDIETINNWCNEKTHGKINKIINEIKPQDVMIILNGIYFNALWKIPFDKKNNFKKNFLNFNKEEKKVEFMSLKEEFKFYDDEEIQVVFLKYKKESLNAIIILPNKEINLDDYIKNFTKEKFGEIILNAKETKIVLNLPKFEINYETELKPYLKNLGINQAFNLNANFTGISQEKNIFINQILHKTFIKVDEQGTEISCITEVELTLDLPLEINVDHPFLFVITDDELPSDYKILFIAKIETL